MTIRVHLIREHQIGYMPANDSDNDYIRRVMEAVEGVQQVGEPRTLPGDDDKRMRTVSYRAVEGRSVDTARAVAQALNDDDNFELVSSAARWLSDDRG